MARVFMYLSFGIIWLAVAGFMLLMPLLGHGGQQFNIRGTDVSVGWLVLLLAGYNLLKAWLWFRRERRAAREPEITPRRPSPREAEYHPEFDFSRDDLER